MLSASVWPTLTVIEDGLPASCSMVVTERANANERGPEVVVGWSQAMPCPPLFARPRSFLASRGRSTSQFISAQPGPFRLLSFSFFFFLFEIRWLPHSPITIRNRQA